MKKGRIILMVGISGSGKSTQADRFEATIPNSVVLSSDALRGIIGIDETDQNVNPIVFATLRTMAEYFLKRDRVVIIDATNVSVKDRRPFVEIAKKLNAEIHAYVINVAPVIAKERNSLRERKVPEYVIDKQISKFSMPTLQEVDMVLTDFLIC